LIRQP